MLQHGFPEMHAHDVSRTRGHNKQRRMIQNHAGLGRPVGTGRAEAQMHIVGSLTHCRGAHGLHIDIEDINSQHVTAQIHSGGVSRACVKS